MPISRSKLIAADLAILALALPLAATLRVEGLTWMAPWGASIALWLLVSFPLRVTIWSRFHMARRAWSTASVPDLFDLTVAITVLISTGWAVSAVGGLLGRMGDAAGTQGHLPWSFLLMEAGLIALGLPMVRLAPRLLQHLVARGGLRGLFSPAELGRVPLRVAAEPRTEPRRALIVGAGEAGALLARQLLAHPHFGLQPVAFVDDDARKHGVRIHRVPVLGSTSHLAEYLDAHAVDEIIVAAPSVAPRLLRTVMTAAQGKHLPVRTMRSVEQSVVDSRGGPDLKPIELSDLLRRDPIETDLAALSHLVANTTVLVTGAGGSIGSELARQILRRRPTRLVVLGHGENSIFELMADLDEIRRLEQIETMLVPQIADIRDAARMETVFSTHRPSLVLHAAAHKHVPLMEANPADAITNNILGTRVLLEAAERHGVERFILVSSDKAVRPTNVMGATKRAAEQLVQEAAARHGRPWAAVRFGNVLGSRGSVIPTFMRQIARGGPITLTHDGMTRYFMLIPEAVQLVLQATLFARAGDVFVLDMGEPVRIRTLAEDVIRLAGFTPDVDIAIRVTGARPGEKIHEELFFTAETTDRTAHPKIMRARAVAAPASTAVEAEATIQLALSGASGAALRVALGTLVPDYAPDQALAHQDGAPSTAAGGAGVTPVVPPAPLLPTWPPMGGGRIDRGSSQLPA